MDEAADPLEDTDLSRRPWTQEEDDAVVRLVHELGTKKWSQIAGMLVGRTGKQCRERWHNQLDPEIKKHNWTPEEEAMLVEAHRKFGNKWAKIAACLPGRTDNAIKNHWNSALRRELRKLNRHKGTSEPGTPAEASAAEAAAAPPALSVALAAPARGSAAGALSGEPAAPLGAAILVLSQPFGAALAGAPAAPSAPQAGAASARQPAAALAVKTEPSLGAGQLATTVRAASAAPRPAAQTSALLSAPSAAGGAPSAGPSARVVAEPPRPHAAAAAPSAAGAGSRKRRSTGEGPDRDIAKGTKQVLMQNISHLNQLWSHAVNPPPGSDAESLEKHVGWLQSFCDSLVESSLQASVELVNNNKKLKAEADAQLQLLAQERGGCDARGGGAADAGGAAGATPLAKHAMRMMALTPGRGTPFGSRSNLLNELMHFDVDELLMIVGTQAASCSAAILASPRHRLPGAASPLGGGVGSAGAKSAQRLAAERLGQLPPHLGGQRLNELCHRLLFSPRTAQQLAPPLPLGGDENAHAHKAGGGSALGGSAHPGATPRNQRSLGFGLLSAARALTPRSALTPITPGSSRLTPDDLLGFLNLDALLTPATNVPGSSGGAESSLQGLRTLNMSPFPMAPMPTPAKADKSAPSLAAPMAISPEARAAFAVPAGKRSAADETVAATVLSCPPPAQPRAPAALGAAVAGLPAGSRARDSLLCDEEDL